MIKLLLLKYERTAVAWPHAHRGARLTTQGQQQHQRRHGGRGVPVPLSPAPPQTFFPPALHWGEPTLRLLSTRLSFVSPFTVVHLLIFALWLFGLSVYTFYPPAMSQEEPHTPSVHQSLSPSLSLVFILSLNLFTCPAGLFVPLPELGLAHAPLLVWMFHKTAVVGPVQRVMNFHLLSVCFSCSGNSLLIYMLHH